MRLSTSKIVASRKLQVTNKKTTGRKKLLAACSLFLIAILGMACRPTPTVFIKKLRNNNFQLIVNHKPYVVKGVCYNPIPTGKGYDVDWWGDESKPWLVDGKLMQDMGVNTIRLYQPHEHAEEMKKVISDLYNTYGIRTIMGHWLGFWEYPCPLYANPDFQAKIKKEVLDMVSQLKDEPGILMWVLGNENNYSCLGRINPWSSDELDQEPDPQKRNNKRMRIYYSFINELAGEIHKIDPNHPVALGNGELLGLEVAKEVSPDIDLVACIIYRGRTFGNLFRALKTTYDMPILITEFGADAYDAYKKKEDQNMQAFFLESQWRQIYENLAGNKEGMGNCLGGTIFEWTDEWWKHNQGDPESWGVHDLQGNWQNGNYYFDNREGIKNMNEEWFGIVALSDQIENGLNKRVPRKAYYVIREFWKNPLAKTKLREGGTK